MQCSPCEELELLTQRLKYAILRKNELITANLFGKWMMAAEVDLTRTNELLTNHSNTCNICSAQWPAPSKPNTHKEMGVVEEQYPPEDPERPFRAPPRRMYRPHLASVLQFPSIDPNL
jgi:hypothetical protein